MTPTEQWRHVSGIWRFITRPELLPDKALAQYLDTIRAGIGLPH